MKITPRQLRQIISEAIDSGHGDFGDVMPHQRHPDDVAIELSSVLPPLALKKKDSGEISQDEFEQIRAAFRIVHDFLTSVPRV
jgi:hypothetical protein